MKIDKLVEVMKKLRAPDGCPWDRAQTHHSLMPFIMDECGELLDAIAAQDDANFREELGDVLMHIVLHSVMAEERGAFTFDDVVEGITAKMISRHPHVFGKEAVRHVDECYAVLFAQFGEDRIVVFVDLALGVVRVAVAVDRHVGLEQDDQLEAVFVYGVGHLPEQSVKRYAVFVHVLGGVIEPAGILDVDVGLLYVAPLVGEQVGVGYLLEQGDDPALIRPAVR